jgi:hypothetical protein
MSVGLSGNLRDFGIADVFQLIGQQRKTGTLSLKRRGSRARLVFDRGAVVSAVPVLEDDADPIGDMLLRCGLLRREQVQEVGVAARASAEPLSRLVAERGWLPAQDLDRIEDLLTRDVVFDVLRWESGSFDFRAEDIEHDRDPAALLAAEQILMDGLRMLDEWRSFESHVSSDDAVFQRAGRFEAYRQKATRATPSDLEQAERVFALIDGRLTAKRVVDLSQLGVFDGTRALADLVAAGAVKQVAAEPGSRRARLAAPGRSGAALRRAVAGALPIALLLVAALSVRSAPPGGVIEGAWPIDASSLDAIHEAYATRRVRKAVDTYRFVEGEAPADLEALRDGALLDDAALAGASGRAYYSFHQDHGVVVLAPER